MKTALIIVLSFVFTAVGLAGGWYAASQKKDAGGHGHGHGHGESPEPAGADAHGHAHGVAPKLSPQAIKNLGLTVAEVDTQNYFTVRRIPAEIEEHPAVVQPVVAPVGGTVLEVRAEVGTVAAGGTVVVTLVRDPLERPSLTLTEEIMKPVSEHYHTAIGDLRRALKGVQLLQTELKRVQEFTRTASTGGLAVLPKKTEIDLSYELARAEQELANAREKLRLHGFDDKQIGDIEAGQNVSPKSDAIWRRALQRNGLWSTQAEALFNALPLESREAPWTVAAIGELSGAGLVTQRLVDWIKETPGAGVRFLEIAGLLQKGHSLEHVRALEQQNALNPIVEIRAPALAGGADWDIKQILVRPSERVEAGTRLLLLSNPRKMKLVAMPAGSEMPVLIKALEDGTEMEATPLIEGAGPVLKKLRIAYFSNPAEHSEGRAAGTPACIKVTNEPLVQGHYRTWRLRPGQKYMLRVPAQQWKDVFVLPSAAVTDDGPDKVVFAQNGDSFEPRKVVVLHQDDEVAVLDSAHSDLFPGDPIVQRNAFGLGLALKAGSGAVDPHAGHSH